MARADGWQAALASALRPAAFARRSATSLGVTGTDYGANLVKIPENKESQAAGIEERKEAAVKQTCLFMDAALLAINTETLNQETSKVGACLFFVGAADALTQHYKLDDAEFFEVAFRVLRYFGVSEQNAGLFLKGFAVMAQEPFGRDALIEGGNAIKHWLFGKDSNAPLRLFDLVKEWKDVRL